MNNFGHIPIERRSFSPIHIGVHIFAWLPLGWLTWLYLSGGLGVNPTQLIEQRTGIIALVLLILSLASTPLYLLFGWREANKLRRPLGLYAFMYAALHFLVYLGLDYGFNLNFLLADVTGKLYILLGTLSLVILLALAITGFAWWQKQLGKHWKTLHRLVYLAAILAVWHFALAKKGDLFTLKGDERLPFIYGIILILLLAMRLSFIRQALFRLRLFVKGSFVFPSKR